MAPNISNQPRCSHCEKSIKDNQPSISCRSCLSWFHKGCSGLTNPEFNKQASLWNKSKETTWACNPCLNLMKSESTNKQTPTSHPRRSIGPGAAPPHAAVTNVDESSNCLTNNKVSLNDIMEKLLYIESLYTNLLSKYEDQIKINADLRSEIAEIKLGLSTGNRTNNPAVNHGTAGQGQEDVILREILQRQARMNNVVIFNLRLEEGIPESVQISSLLSNGLSRQIEVSNVVTVGRANRNGHKPVKVTLSNSSDVLFVLKNRKVLTDSHQIYIEADLSPAQLGRLREVREELRLRRSNGEKNLILRYSDGIPRITTKNLVPPLPTATC